jgi:hypothetical protein
MKGVALGSSYTLQRSTNFFITNVVSNLYTGTGSGFKLFITNGHFI